MLPGWFGVLKPDMSEDEMRAAIGSPGRPWSEHPGGTGLLWEMEKVIVKAAFLEGRATYIGITFTLGERPVTQAAALREIAIGMSQADVERLCGGPGLVRSRVLVAESVDETREWRIFDGDLDAGSSLTIKLHDGRVSNIGHPWMERQ